jgi:hypothetical protein
VLWTETTKLKWPIHTKENIAEHTHLMIYGNIRLAVKYTQSTARASTVAISYCATSDRLHESAGSKQNFEYSHLLRHLTAKRACLTFTHTS